MITNIQDAWLEVAKEIEEKRMFFICYAIYNLHNNFKINFEMQEKLISVMNAYGLKHKITSCSFWSVDAQEERVNFCKAMAEGREFPYRGYNPGGQI